MTANLVSVVAANAGAVTYAWYKDGNALTEGGDYTGVSKSKLKVSDLASGVNDGAFVVKATNICGTVNSNTATVAVSTSVLSITTQPVSQQICVGSDLNLSVVANGSSTLSYVWKKSGVALVDGGAVAGSSTANLIITGITNTDLNDYTVDVSSLCGVLESDTAFISSGAPSISVHPTSQTACTGASEF